jgi:CheY-like chemotaxis protein
MDVQMPEMDGFQCTTAIREYQKKRQIRTPIIALTANAMTGDRERCLASGMDDYLSKPIRPAELLKMVERYLKRPEPVLSQFELMSETSNLLLRH